MVLKALETKARFDDFVQQPGVNLVHFSASWAPVCDQLNKVLDELQNEIKGFNAATIDAEGVPDVSMQHGITAAPTVVIFKGGKEVDKLNGYHPTEIKNAIIKHSFAAGPVKEHEPEAKEDLNSRLKRLINHSRLTLFMKGNADTPRCGFSRQMVDLLKGVKAEFWTFDILSDEEVRQGLKAYSDWPTYPQLYLDGELLGGLDVVREELQNTEFVDKLPKAK